MGVLYTICVGIPICLTCMCVALFLCLTIIGIPIGLTIMALGVKYLALPQRRWV
jgi:uncharacterized membrane protein YccF (DUF307 family)